MLNVFRHGAPAPASPISVLLWLTLVVPLSVKSADDCDNTDFPSGSAMHTGCVAQNELEAADKKLNETYQKLIRGMEPDEPDNYPKKALVEAQRAWIKYSDASCELEAELSGAVRMWKSANFVSCKANMTEKRTDELKKMFAD